MDQKTENASEKRNWRERLGIAKNAGADLPKLSDDLASGQDVEHSTHPHSPQAEHKHHAPLERAESGKADHHTKSHAHHPAKAAPRHPAKAAPMAPRAVARPAAKPAAAVSAPVVTASTIAPLSKSTVIVPPAPQAKPAAAPLPTDILANRLKDQREAAERLAQQRIEAARHKAQTAAAPVLPGAKPKFNFADADQPSPMIAPAPSAALAPAPRPAAPPPVAVTRPAAPAAIARPAAPVVAPRATTPVAAPSPAAPPRPAATPQATSPQPQQVQQPVHQPVQPARVPLGGNGAFVPPPGYPQQAFNPQVPKPGAFAPQPFPYQQQPQFRPIDPNTGFAAQAMQPPRQPGFVPPPGPRVQMPPRAPALNPGSRFANPPARSSGPQMPMADAASDDVFESPSPIAPRRATANDYSQAYRDDTAYEDSPPRGRALGFILGMVLFAMLAGTAAAYYWVTYGKKQFGSGGGNVPVISAPAQPTRVTTPDPGAAPAADSASKKVIFDRIEGDHEVPGGPLKTTEQPPAIQQNGTNPPAGTPQPQPAGNGAAPIQPPKPASGQQGALPPDGTTDTANATQAAEPSSAAQSSEVGDLVQAPAQNDIVVAIPASAPPQQNASAIAPPPEVKPTTIVAAPTTQQEPLVAKPVAPKPSVQAKAADAETVTEEDTAPAETVKKPAPAKQSAKRPKVTVAEDQPDDSLGAEPVVLVPPGKVAAVPRVVRQAARAEQVAPIDSLYGGDSQVAGDLYGGGSVAAPVSKPVRVAAASPAATAPPVAAPPENRGSGAYVVQLASFNSRADASTEYQRLNSKHGAIISRFAPIIETAQVAGTTRYRLNLGPMATSDAASSLCSSLISAGERDCLVRRQ